MTYSQTSLAQDTIPLYDFFPCCTCVQQFIFISFNLLISYPQRFKLEAFVIDEKLYKFIKFISFICCMYNVFSTFCASKLISIFFNKIIVCFSILSKYVKYRMLFRFSRPHAISRSATVFLCNIV